MREIGVDCGSIVEYALTIDRSSIIILDNELKVSVAVLFAAIICVMIIFYIKKKVNDIDENINSMQKTTLRNLWFRW